MDRIFYCDGSCRKNPGPGGFGVIELVKYNEDTYVNYSYNEQCEDTTNNREELKAILHIFEMAEKDKNTNYIIYSDSAYCVNIVNNWIYNWAKNNWLNSKKKIVENIDLIQILYKYINTEFFNCQVIKTAGHCGIIENELADALATNNLVKYNSLIEKYDIKK